MKVGTRTVLLLGRRPSVTWEALRAGLREGDELVVLSLGYPVTSGQEAAFLRAQDLAAEAGAWFDAILLTSADGLRAALRSDDRVHIAARGRQGKRLNAAIGARRPHIL